MVRIISLAASFLALLVSTEACQGYFQCKYTDGSHCCVIFSSKGRDACPSYCNGATAGWDPECISTLTGNKRKLCDN